MKEILVFCSVIILVFVMMAGCSSTEQELQPKRAFSLENPDYIGQVDGKTLYRATIVNSGLRHDHYIYFFKNETNQPVTVNSTVSHGKTTSNQTVVIINGQEFVPLQK